MFGDLATIATDFTPERLTLIREARALSMSALAAAISATPSAISQFESGNARPAPETVVTLANYFGVRPDFFSAAPAPEINFEDCHFRHRRKATAVEKRRVIALGSFMLEVLDQVQNFVTLPSSALESSPLSTDNPEEIECLAESIRSDWGLGFGPLSNIVWLVEQKGAAVLEINGHSEALDAFSTWTSNRPVIFLASEKESASRRRFDIGHELGHLLMHREARPGDRLLEAQADRFAGAFLLPRETFVAECPKRLVWPYLIEMKKRWYVSLQAIVRRAYELGIYSQATYRRANIQLRQRGWHVVEPDEPPLERPALLSEAIRVLTSSGLSVRQLLDELPPQPFEARRMVQLALS